MLKTIKTITETAVFRLSLFLLLAVNLIGISLLLYQNSTAEKYDLSLMKDALILLDNHGYYDLPENAKLNHGFIRGMLTEYGDPYTSFFAPPEHEIQMDRLAGKFGGIGIHLFINAEGEYIITPYENSPAIEAGIENGDILLSVDGILTAEFGAVNEILAYLHAEEGTEVDIEVKKAGSSENISLTIERREIHQPSVFAYLVNEFPKIAVIDVNVIGAETPNEIKAAIYGYQNEGVDQFILDLQTNYGGFLTEAVDISRLFLTEGLILQENSANGQVTDFEATEKGEFADLSFVVLINDQTASAAEIIAGILQTYRDVTVIGSHSFGKNTIQLVFELDDLSSMHITHAKWNIPDLSYDFEERGIQPDIWVDFGEDFSSRSIQAAIDYLLQNP